MMLSSPISSTDSIHILLVEDDDGDAMWQLKEF